MADNKISFINFSTSLNLLKKVEPKSKNDEQNLGLELKNADSVNELKFVDEEYPIILPESDKYTTNAMGEEGGDMKTTLATGEEGGAMVTTNAIGEEGGHTTFATGEEGGDSSPPEIKPYIEKEPEYTTLAMGEEGGAMVTTNAIGEEGGHTTFATGEEGGDSSPPEIKPYIEKEPEYTTLAIGEDGGAMVTTNAIGEEGGAMVTTNAMGEEGGAGPLIPIEPFNIKPESLLEKLIKRMNVISFIPWYK